MCTSTDLYLCVYNCVALYNIESKIRFCKNKIYSTLNLLLSFIHIRKKKGISGYFRLTQASSLRCFICH